MHHPTEAFSQGATVASRRRRWWRFLWWAGGLGGLLVVAPCGWGYWQLRGSLPKLDGELAGLALHAAVQIERDAAGVPSITADSRADAAFALGWLHAQDRFFQMDLLRRLSAGRLSELFGAAAVSNDRQYRVHRFSVLAEQLVERLSPPQASALTAYTAGVNAGLAQLRKPPPEYLLLRQSPQPWRAADAFLVMMTMLCDLQSKDSLEDIWLGRLQERLPGSVFQFLTRRGSRWDAALDDSRLALPAIPPLDGWSWAELAKACSQPASFPPGDTDRLAWLAPRPPEFLVGSNNWAVGAAAGREQRAILASDMHLGLSVPTIWYRALIETPLLDGRQRRLVGVTLPGTPVLIEGSNGRVAWGFTNSYGKFGDVVELDMLADQPGHYRTAEGPKSLERFEEKIEYPGGHSVCEYEWSQWGPVVHQANQRYFVHRWIGHDPSAFDLSLMELEGVDSVLEGMAAANRSGMPNQNVMLADDAGNIGWTLSGRIPRRPAPPAGLPLDWSAGEGVWQGYLTPEEYPRVYNPADARLWTANNRVLGGEYLERVGNGGFDMGARARQIRDRLREQPVLAEQDLLAIQLDDEARFLSDWRRLLLEVIESGEVNVSPELVEQVRSSADRAAVDAVGYRLVRSFRLEVLVRTLSFLGGAAWSWDGRQVPWAAYGGRLLVEDIAWQLLEERPDDWLPEGYASWDELLVAAAEAVEEQLGGLGGVSEARWGRYNRATIRHPLSMAVPQLGWWLNMPAVELPGDNHMPRVQAPSAGASQRLVVSPGQEERGIYHQPGGQSGHWLSPFYRTGFDDWAYGRPSPLLPGPTRHRLTLSP
jgi:penicillin G amidase